MPQASGLAREAGRLWTSDVEHERILRSSCDIIPAIEFLPKDLDVRDLAWDGDHLWVMNTSGKIVSYSEAGDPADVIDGLLACGWGLTWADGLLWASDPESSMLYYITRYADTPHLFLRDYLIIDSLGNGNGRLDAGETAELSVRITNCGGEAVDSVQGLLTSNDPFLVIGMAQVKFGNIPIGASVMNTGNPFTVHADAVTPEGHRAKLHLVLSAPGFADTLEFTVRVGRACGDYLVWDPDPNHSSGPAVHCLLDLLQYKGEYTTSLTEYLDVLERFKSIWVFCGQYPFREIISVNSIEAESLQYYLRYHDGCMYLEGAEVFYYDPIMAMGCDFGPLFGILGLSDGNCDLDTILGEEGTFAEAMGFPYAGENSWIDRMEPRYGSYAYSLFYNNNPPYCCCIACPDPNHRTIGASFEIAGLMDNDSCTKYALVDSMMHFFGITAGAYEEGGAMPGFSMDVMSIPNPARHHCVIWYSVSKASTVRMLMYDASGRVVWVLVDGRVEPGIHKKRADLARLPNGVYFMKLTVDDRSYTRKLTIVK